MRYQPAIDAVTGETYLPVAERGRMLLEEPLLNKGTAFARDERNALRLTGLLPSHVSTLEEQVERTLEQFHAKESDLQKHIYLAGLQDRNETLFFRLVMDNLETMVPIIYTPTVAEACRHWSQIFRRSRGVYITPDDRGHLERLLQNRGLTEAAVVVMTDNERILGIGDQGAGGMGIPIGKLALYTAGAGIHPSLCVPISLDVGTDNEELLEDPMYLGYRRPRLRGDAYWNLVDETVEAITSAYPAALVQWEDFANKTSFRHLETHRKTVPSFNDDIQGTAAMVVGGLYAAMRRTGERLANQRYAIAGAGSAGIGIGRLILAALIEQGVDPDDAQARIVMTDSRGLIVEGRHGGEERKAEFATPAATIVGWGVTADEIDLATAVEHHRPTVLIGVTGRPGLITEPMVRTMAATTRHPVVMPLSNPTAFTEIEPEDALRWSEGRALVASGSPFPDVTLDGIRHRIGQANNVFIFPGMGLGALASRARVVTDGMFLAGARALAAEVGDSDLASGALYPPITAVRDVSGSVALAVGRAAVHEGVAAPTIDLAAAIHRATWDPVYLPYRPA